MAKLIFRRKLDIESGERQKIWVGVKILMVKNPNWRKNVGGCQKFGWKKSKKWKKVGGCQKFGRKKSEKWKKLGGRCNSGPILENRPYLPGTFS